MSATFLKTQNGDLLNVAQITKLHTDYLPTFHQDGQQELAVFADGHEIGVPRPLAAAGNTGSAKELCNLLAVRMSSRPGVYAIQDGRITHRFINAGNGNLRTVGYGSFGPDNLVK